MATSKRAQQIFAYFKKYNYEVKDAGDVIRFVGNYKASRGQAAALTFYVFMGECSSFLTSVLTCEMREFSCCHSAGFGHSGLENHYCNE